MTQHARLVALAVATLVVASGCDSSATSSPSMTDYLDALRNGDEPVVRRALVAHPQWATMKGRPDHSTPLHLASYCGSQPVVRLLLSYGADVNAVDDDGWAPLHMAGSDQMGRLLVSRGARVDLHAAAWLGWNDRIRKFLRKNPGAISERKGDGWTPLFMAVRGCEPKAAALLLDKGADVNDQCDEGWTVLHQAVHYHHDMETIDLLISRGANVDATQYGYWTPLHEAAENGSVEAARRLLDHGATVDARTRWKRTSLHYAAMEGAVDVIDLLIARRAEVDARDEDETTPLHLAASYGNRDAVDALLRHKAALEAVDEDGWTPLIFAANSGWVDVVRMLIAKGANVNARSTDGGWTPLSVAAYRGYTDVTNELLKSGAEVNAKDDRGCTALTHAIGRKNDALADILRKHGAVQ